MLLLSSAWLNIKLVPGFTFPPFGPIREALSTLNGAPIVIDRDLEAETLVQLQPEAYPHREVGHLNLPQSYLHDWSTFIDTEKDSMRAFLSKPAESIKRIIGIAASKEPDDTLLAGSEQETRKKTGITVGVVRNECEEWLDDNNLKAIIQPGWIDTFLTNAKKKLENHVTTIKKVNNFAAQCLKRPIPHPELIPTKASTMSYGSAI